LRVENTFYLKIIEKKNIILKIFQLELLSRRCKEKKPPITSLLFEAAPIIYDTLQKLNLSEAIRPTTNQQLACWHR
jgi:hypothetical protein